MAKFRKKPVVIEAMQLPNYGEQPSEELVHFINTISEWEQYKESVIIKTFEGEMRADPLDWIIKDVQGEFYPCKPDIFEKNYEAVV